MTDKDKMDKTLFVHNELQTLLKKVNPNISKVEFMGTDTGEFVIVTIVSGYSYRINITGNSLIEIASDVINFVKFK
ncbi:MAG: hypothetical protein GX957_05090 [Clostridiaceae bacterium]|nr:hypothetical protein [Clostridiaceae bacterium]